NMTIVFPLAYQDGLTPHLEINENLNALFEITKVNYNVGIDPVTDDIDINQVTEENMLATTYRTTRYVNIATNSSVPVYLYNYITRYSEIQQAYVPHKINIGDSVIANSYSASIFEITTQTI